MNCLTRLLALGVLALGTAGHSAAALAALPSAHSSLSEGRDRDSFEVAQSFPAPRPIDSRPFPLCAVVSRDTSIRASGLDFADRVGELKREDGVAIFTQDTQEEWIYVVPLDNTDVQSSDPSQQVRGFIRSQYIQRTNQCPPQIRIQPTSSSPTPAPSRAEAGCYLSNEETLLVYDNPRSTAGILETSYGFGDKVKIADRTLVSDSAGEQWIRLMINSEDEPRELGWVRFSYLNYLGSSSCA